MDEAEILDQICVAAHARDRLIIGIAGPPGSGKSTMAKRLFKALNARLADQPACIVPMDGFHYDNAVLEPLGLLARKGAPATFDADAFVRLIHELRQAKRPISIPIFDNRLDLARAQGAMVEIRHRILLVEGNYLLLQDTPWNALLPLFDKTLFLSPPLALLEERLIRRWLDQGLEKGAAMQRARGNDLANAQTVLQQSAPADWVLA